jgi:formate dehydrogenase alpha subunit
VDYRTVLTTCPYCGCGCGIHLPVLDGRLGQPIPDRTHPLSEGRLCIKGWSAHEHVASQDRLTRPLVREGDGFREATWEEALDLIASRLMAIRDEYGPDGLAFLSSAKCTNEENYLLQKLARAVIGTNNVDHCARLCHSPTVAGLVTAFGSGAMTNSVPELEDADCILITGSNTSENHPLISARVLRAKRRGGKLIVVDPRYIHLARFADVYARPRPGTDVAWINGLMHIILAEGWEDREFIAARTEGFDGLREKVAEYTPERVEAITGIEQEQLREVARLYACAERAAIIYAMGITQHTTGTDNVLSLANLAMLTGNVGKRSTGVNPLRGQNNVQGACDVGGLPNVFPGYQQVTDPQVRDKFEKAWLKGGGSQSAVGELSAEPGLTVVEMMNAAAEGVLKGMYILAENPTLSDPDVNHVRAALQNLEFLVVQDIFLTRTAELADVILPGSSFAERDGTVTSTGRSVQRMRKAIETPGEARADWEIICQVAQQCAAGGFGYASPEEVFAEMASLTPIYGGISYARLESEWLRWPCRSPDDPGTEFLHRDQFARGRGLFTPVDYREPAENPDEQYPFVLTTGRLIFHFHTGTLTRRSPSLAREVEEGFVELSPYNAQQLGVRDGEMVTVASRRGEIEVKAKVTPTVPRGVVFIPFHFAESAANVLTHRALDPVAKIPEYKVCAVSIVRSR